MDIGGHRFFSKSDRVMRWWLELMPVEAGTGEEGQLRYQGQQRDVPAAAQHPIRKPKIWSCWFASARAASISCAAFLTTPSA